MELLFYGSIFLIALSFLALTILSFKQSFWWGILCFVISPLPFSFIYWHQTKKWLGVLIIGTLMLVPVYITKTNAMELYMDDAADIVREILAEQDKQGVFASGETHSIIGNLISCEESGELGASFTKLSSTFPIEWTWRVQCRFTQKTKMLRVELLQIDKDKWHHHDTVVEL